MRLLLLLYGISKLVFKKDLIYQYNLQMAYLEALIDIILFFQTLEILKLVKKISKKIKTRYASTLLNR
jgi:hypothetical protein